MTFTGFNNREGHQRMSADVLAALKDIEQRHGVSFSVNGGSLGSTDMVLKLQVKPTDTKLIEDGEKRQWGFNCRYVGLEAEDYGATVSWGSGTYRIVEVATSRPKYPLGGICVRTGKKFKFPRNMAAMIISGRASRPAPALIPETPMSGYTAHF